MPEVRHHRASTRAVAPDPEELCRRFVAGVGFDLEVWISSSPVQAVPDLRPRRTDIEPYDTHAVGGCDE